MKWIEIENALKVCIKKDILIYDDSYKDGNQYINVLNKEKKLFRISRPHMNRLKKLGYKIKRRTLE